jgi:hypothetical protein
MRGAASPSRGAFWSVANRPEDHFPNGIRKVNILYIGSETRPTIRQAPAIFLNGAESSPDDARRGRSRCPLPLRVSGELLSWSHPLNANSARLNASVWPRKRQVCECGIFCSTWHGRGHALRSKQNNGARTDHPLGLQRLLRETHQETQSSSSHFHLAFPRERLLS